MIYEEKTMKSEKIYEGKIINLKLDTVELPDQKYTKREIVEHPGAVAIVPITADNELVLVKQFRKAIEEAIIEIPAGKLEHGEDPASCAVRELKEETGFTAEKIQYVFQFYTSPGFSNEKMHLFVATGLAEGTAEPENDEYIEIIKIKLDNLLNMINNGEITDSKSIIGILMANNIINSKQE